MAEFSGITFAGKGRWPVCEVCGLPILEGQRIRQRDEDFIHADCDGPFHE